MIYNMNNKMRNLMHMTNEASKVNMCIISAITSGLIYS